jgi:glucose/arabinose dehydrogenase
MSEHGVRGGDEINAVEKGKNYGFPVIGYGREYTGKPINNDKTSRPAWNSPCISGRPISRPRESLSITQALPEWQGDLFVAEMVGRTLVRLVLNGERVIAKSDY